MSDLNQFIMAIRLENIKDVKRLFNRKFINLKSNGYTVLHWAAVYNNKGDIVKYLLSEGCNIEEKTDFGSNAIHLSVKYSKVEVLKTLIEAGCSLKCVDKDGRTPMCLAIDREDKECVDILKNGIMNIESYDIREELGLLEKNSLSKIIDYKTGKTLLDRLLLKKDPRILEAIRLKSVDYQEIKEWRDLKVTEVDPKSYKLLQECILVRSILHKFYEGIEELCTPDMANKNSLFMGPSTLEIVVESGLLPLYVREILWKLEKYDESWTKAEDIARRSDNEKISNLISERREYLASQEKKGFDRLHVASIENDTKMIQYILEHHLVNPDEIHKNGSTALTLSYNIGHTKCVQTLQKNNVDVNIVDKLRQSALHSAIYNRIEDESKYLVDNLKDIESRDFMDFTVLERSVMNDCKYICERLVSKGAKCDKIVQFDQRLFNIDSDLSMILFNTPQLPLASSETIYTLCFKVNKVIYPALFETLDKNTVNLTDGFGNSLLHIYAISLKGDVCLNLIGRSANVNLENKNKRKPIFELLIQNYNEGENKVNGDILNTVNILIDAGATLNGKDVNECSIFEIATKYNSEKLLLDLIHKKEPLNDLGKLQWLLWFDMKYYTLMKEVFPLIQNSLLCQWITKEMIKKCLDDKNIKLAKIMFDKASSDIKIQTVEKMLHEVSIAGDKTLFEELIECDIPSEMSLDEEESLMNYVIKEKNFEFILIILYSKNGDMYLEKEGANKKLPLHVCIEYEYWEIIDQLIFYTKSVNKEDDNGDTPLSLLLTKISETKDAQFIHKLMTYVIKLISKSADINKVNKINKSIISYCTKPHLKEKIQAIFKEKRRKERISTKIVNPMERADVKNCPTSMTVYADLYEEVGSSSSSNANINDNITHVVHFEDTDPNNLSSLNTTFIPEIDLMDPPTFDSNILELYSVPE